MIETEESIRQKYPLAMDEHEAPDPVKAPKPAAVPQPAKQREIAKETATVTAVKPQVQASPPKSAGQTPGKKADALLKQADAISQRAQVPAADIIEDAEVILKTGTPLESLLNGFRLNHAGHEENARAIIYAFCAQSSATSKGIQPEVTGSKGSGKSHSIASTLFMMPEEYIWESSFSPKYLYYKPPQQGCIIYIDERLSEDLVNLVKKIMSNFQRETRHSTSCGTWQARRARYPQTDRYHGVYRQRCGG